jgi:uncharacterized protein (TIGR03437 family)
VGSEVWKVTPSNQSIPIAGTSYGSTAGDNGPAVNARISPTALALDSENRLYIFDSGTETVRVVAPDGTIRTYAGRGPFEDGRPATETDVSQAAGVAIDVQGNVYFTESRWHRIRRIDRNGVVWNVAGTGYPGFFGDGGPALAAQFQNPSELAFDGAGNLYVSDKGNHRVRVISPDGLIRTVAGHGLRTYVSDGPALSVHLAAPAGLVFDRAGNLFIADTDNHRVFKLGLDGQIRTVAGTGQVTSNGDGGAGTAAAVAGPEGLAVDSAGNVYIADRFSHNVRRLAADGVIRTVAAGLRIPYSLATDAQDTLYIGDVNGAAILKLAPGGSVGPVSCAVAPDSGLFPYGLAVDSAGSLTIAGYSSIFRMTAGPAPLPEILMVFSAADPSHLAGPVAPGEMVSIQMSGTWAQDATAAPGVDGRFPMELAGVRVWFDDYPAPMVKLAYNRTVALVPYAISRQAKCRVQVEIDGRRTNPLTIGVVNAYPSIFGEPLVARKGSVLSFWATGQGEMNPMPVDGQVAKPPLAVPKLPVSLKIGGNPAEILYAGAAPGLAGTIQINARVPVAEPIET